MRKIEKTITDFVHNCIMDYSAYGIGDNYCKTFSSRDSVVVSELVDGLTIRYFLHGSNVVTVKVNKKNEAVDNGLSIDVCPHGYFTLTTKSRINAFMDVLRLPKVFQQNFCWYFHGYEQEFINTAHFFYSYKNGLKDVEIK